MYIINNASPTNVNDIYQNDVIRPYLRHQLSVYDSLRCAGQNHKSMYFKVTSYRLWINLASIKRFHGCDIFFVKLGVICKTFHKID